MEHVKDASRVDRNVIENTVGILQKAGVVKEEAQVEELVVQEAF